MLSRASFLVCAGVHPLVTCCDKTITNLCASALYDGSSELKDGYGPARIGKDALVPQSSGAPHLPGVDVRVSTLLICAI